MAAFPEEEATRLRGGLALMVQSELGAPRIRSGKKHRRFSGLRTRGIGRPRCHASLLRAVGRSGRLSAGMSGEEHREVDRAGERQRAAPVFFAFGANARCTGGFLNDSERLVRPTGFVPAASSNLRDAACLKAVGSDVRAKREWRARQDSNLWPSAPEADALSS